DTVQTQWAKRWHEELSAAWTVLTPASLTSTNGSQFKILDDKSVLVTGPNPDQDVHEMAVPLDAGELAGIRLEVLPDESLPRQGSGRADDGRFELSQVAAELVTPDADGHPGEPKQLKFARAA